MHASHSRSSSALNAQDDRKSVARDVLVDQARRQNSIRWMHNQGRSSNPRRHRQEARGRGLPANVYVNAWCTRQDPGTHLLAPARCPPDPARRRRHWLSAIARRGADRAVPAAPSVHPRGSGTGTVHLGVASCATSGCEKRPPMPASPKTACGAISPQAKRVKKQQHDIPPTCTGPREKRTNERKKTP
jgi:hypothetical protein